MSLLLVNVNVVCYDVQLFSLSLVVATLYYGGHLVMNNLMSGADLVAFVLYQMQLGFALEVYSSC